MGLDTGDGHTSRKFAGESTQVGAERQEWDGVLVATFEIEGLSF